MSKIIETVTMFFKDASSDKFYIASLEEKDGKYSVPFTYGRRGTAGQSGIKIEGASLEEAQKVYGKLVNEKAAKGYKPDSGVMQLTPYAGVVNDKKSTGLFSQLPNPIDESEAERYINDSAFGAQEKHDGKKIILKYDHEKIVASNKKGFECGYPAEFEKAMIEFCENNNLDTIILDGEAIGANYYVYDILNYNSVDQTHKGYNIRYTLLKSLILPKAFKLSELAVTTDEKRVMCARLKKANKEGMVFKKLSAPLTAGKSHDSMFKWKFYSTATVIVIKHNVKNSIEMGLLDDHGKVIGVGNVTMIGHVKPPINSLVEVKFLYAYKGGCLYQPAYIGPRDDVDYNECSFVAQKIKFKPDEEDI